MLTSLKRKRVIWKIRKLLKKIPIQYSSYTGDFRCRFYLFPHTANTDSLYIHASHYLKHEENALSVAIYFQYAKERLDFTVYLYQNNGNSKRLVKTGEEKNVIYTENRIIPYHQCNGKFFDNLESLLACYPIYLVSHSNSHCLISDDKNKENLKDKCIVEFNTHLPLNGTYLSKEEAKKDYY